MFWGIIMEPNKRYTQEVEKSFHVSQAALDISTGDSEPVQVMICFAKRNYLIGTLQKGKLLQMPLDLNFQTGDVITFTSNGNCHVHLTGYLVPDDLDGLLGAEGISDEESETEEVPALVSKREKRKASENITSQKDKKLKVEANLPDEDSDSDDEDFDPDVSLALSGNDTTLDGEDSEIDTDDSVDDEEEDDDDDDDEENEEEESEEEEEVKQPIKNEKKKSKQNKQKVAVPEVQQNGKPEQKEQKLSKKEKKQQKKNEQKQADTKTVASPAKKQQLPGGVFIEDIRVGSGPVAKSGRRVAVYYEGRLKSNNKTFDSCTKGHGFTFNLGRSEVIKGWDLGVAGMKVGGKRRITCPPHMAYGAKGQPPVIPPNSTLVFDVELKSAP